MVWLEERERVLVSLLLILPPLMCAGGCTRQGIGRALMRRERIADR